MENKENNNSMLVRNLIGEDCLDYEMTIHRVGSEAGENTVIVNLQKGDFRKYFYQRIGYLDSRPMSNRVDGCYYLGKPNNGEHAFIWSHEFNGKVRAIAGLNNTYAGITYPIGFDLNTKQFIGLPINELGLMDEVEITKYLAKSDFINVKFGFDKDFYHEAIKYANFINILNYIYKDTFIGGDIISKWVLSHLGEYNHDKIMEVNELFKSKTK